MSALWYGKVNGKQTFLRPEAKRHVHPMWLKKKAVDMYLEGMSILIKKAKWALEVYRHKCLMQRETMSMDEMWTYIGCRHGSGRNSKWIL